MILGWSPFKIVSISAVLYPRWPPLLKIEISSNGQNCSILSQKVPKFELYKHNDELFNIYYGIFYELWTFAYFDRLCKLEKRRDEIKKNSSPLKLNSQSQPNFAEMIVGWSTFKIMSVSAVLYPRWPPLLKIEISSNGQNWSILSQKVPKFELCKHNDELFKHILRDFLWTFNFCLFWPIMQIRQKGGWNLKTIFSSETTEPISTKLCWNDPWVVPFQNCVRQRRLVSKMAAITKNRNFFKWPKLLYFKPERAKFELYKHNDELFNIYYWIFYELWTFAYFDRLCKLEKRGDEIKKISSPLKLKSQSQPNFAEMILGCFPFKIVSVSTVLYPRWPPLLKIEISSNGQNWSILSQKVPKFKLYKHNDELFNIYYGIFYELLTFAYFDWLYKLEKRGDEIKIFSSPLKPLSQSQPNFAEMILGWSPFKIVSVSTVLYPRWPPLLKIEISSNGQNCSILSQKVPKFELYKHNDELFNIYYGIYYELWTFAYFDRLCKLEKRGDEI